MLLACIDLYLISAIPPYTPYTMISGSWSSMLKSPDTIETQNSPLSWLINVLYNWLHEPPPKTQGLNFYPQSTNQEPHDKNEKPTLDLTVIVFDQFSLPFTIFPHFFSTQIPRELSTQRDRITDQQNELYQVYQNERG